MVAGLSILNSFEDPSCLLQVTGLSGCRVPEPTNAVPRSGGAPFQRYF